MKFFILDFFHRNKTKVNVNVTHNNNSTSAVSHVSIILQASFKAEFSSVNLTSFSEIPDVLQNNRVEVRFLSCSHFYSVNHLISRKYWEKRYNHTNKYNGKPSVDVPKIEPRVSCEFPSMSYLFVHSVKFDHSFTKQLKKQEESWIN